VRTLPFPPLRSAGVAALSSECFKVHTVHEVTPQGRR
jgi:hypothetical protein